MGPMKRGRDQAHIGRGPRALLSLTPKRSSSTRRSPSKPPVWSRTTVDGPSRPSTCPLKERGGCGAGPGTGSDRYRECAEPPGPARFPITEAVTYPGSLPPHRPHVTAGPDVLGDSGSSEVSWGEQEAVRGPKVLKTSQMTLNPSPVPFLLSLGRWLPRVQKKGCVNPRFWQAGDQKTRIFPKFGGPQDS